MPKAKVVPIEAAERIVDAKAIAKLYGWSVQYVNRLAREGVIPFHGRRSGVKVHRRFDPAEVRAALCREVPHANAG